MVLQLQAILDYARNSIAAVDPSIWKAYQMGLGIGVVILTTLILFPGRTTNDDDCDEAANSSSEAITTSESASEKKECMTQTESIAQPNQPQQPQSSRTATSNTRQQTDQTQTGYWTPHRRLNVGVYCIILLVTALFLNQTYSSNNKHPGPGALLGMLFRTYFPKEAAVLTRQRSDKKISKKKKTSKQN
jgi:hypothetical protein